MGRCKNLGSLKLFSLDMHLNYLGFLGGSDRKKSACNTGDLGLISESGRSPGERIGYLLQYSCLENTTDTMGSQRVANDWATNPFTFFQFSSVAQSCPTLCDPTLCTPGLPVHHQLPEFTQTHVIDSRWCHPTISSSVVPFSSHLQSFLASGYFQMSQFFASVGQSIGVSASASVLPMNI